MGIKIKNIAVLLLIFSGILIAALWLVPRNKSDYQKSTVQSVEKQLSYGGTSPHTTDNRDVAMTQMTVEGTNAPVTPVLEEVGTNQRPYDVNAFLALGMESYKRDDLQKALSGFQEALRLEPGNSTAQLMIDKISREARVEDGFKSKEGSHFNVKYESGESDVAGHVVAIILEEAYQKVGSDLGFYPEDSITTILYSATQFTDVTRAPAWSGGIYDGKIRIPVGGLRERTDVLEKVIFHEYTHAVVHRMGGGRVPVWLNEGIAQYEEGQEGDSEQRFRFLVSSGNIVPLTYLEGSFMAMDQNQAMVAYIEGLSAVKYILEEYGAGILIRLVCNYKDGKGSEAAIKDTFQMTYKEFQESWTRNLKKRYGS